MINKIVSKYSRPFKEVSDSEICSNKERAAVIVDEMITDSSQYEMIDLKSIVQEIKNIVNVKQAYEEIDLNIVIDDSHAKIEVSSSILQVILDILNNSVAAFDENSSRKEIKLQFIANEYGLEIECCDNAIVTDKMKEKYNRDITLYVSREIIQKIFNGKMDPCSREYSRSSRYPADNSGKTCFYIAIPYSNSCILKEGYE